jgi:serine/threonine-protein kinase HipA
MLAGYQPKLLLARFGDQWYLPRGRAHSTHILKPSLSRSTRER